MGTSQSSSGSPSGVPMVPPWVPDPAAPDDGAEGGNSGDDDDGSDDTGTHTQQPTAPPPAVPVAPSGRFGPARRDFGRFARNGSSEDMRRGLGHYVSKGLGGSGTATRRFGQTARTAGSLYGALSAASAGQAATPGSPLNPALLQGRSADEIMDAVVEAVRPVDGTQDTEASRYAINNALSDVLNRYPEADLLHLTEEQRLLAIERYIALDVDNRFNLDVGKHLSEKAPSVTAELARFREVRNYIRETVASAFRKVRTTTQALDAERIRSVASATLRETFEVFEGYLS